MPTNDQVPWCRFEWMGDDPLPRVTPPPWFPLTTYPIAPSADYPRGWKGAVLRVAWMEAQGALGIVWTDQDMAFDPVDVRAMRAAIGRNPHAVHAAPYKIWNVDGTWNWCHRQLPDPSRPPVWGAADDTTIDLWGFGLTYVPHRLMLRVAQRQAWDRLVFPDADTTLSRIALEHPRIPAYLVPDASPKHVHWHGVDPL